MARNAIEVLSETLNNQVMVIKASAENTLDGAVSPERVAQRPLITPPRVSPDTSMEFIEAAGHSDGEPPIARALRLGADMLARESGT